MSDLPIPDWLDVSTASFLSTPEDTTDTLDPHSFLFDDQFVNNASLHNNGSNGNPCNDPNALFSDPLLYEDPSLPLEIDRQPQRQPTNQIPSLSATSTVGFQNVYHGCGFLGENVQPESAPGTVSPIDGCHPTKLAVHDHGAAGDPKATVTSNGPGRPAQKMRKRSYVDADSLKCKRAGCKMRQPFNRLQDRRRHEKSIHDSPRSFVCPYDGCHKRKNRKDNLKEHIRRCHQKALSVDESSRVS